jgi:hypothetical protein
MMDEPGPGTVEDAFGEPLRGATHPGFHDRSTDPNGADASEDASDLEARESPGSSKEKPFVLDAIAGILAAPDPQTFLLDLASALARFARFTADGESSLGTMLRQLGHALDEELDEEPAFQDLVDAFERRRFGPRALHEAVPIVAAFVARIVSGPTREFGSAPTPAEIADLVGAAARVAREALESGGARSWRALPEIAARIARRAAQRGSSIGTLAEALPRLWARLGPGPRDTSNSEPDRLRERTKGETRRMVLSGPVEIVILER